MSDEVLHARRGAGGDPTSLTWCGLDRLYPATDVTMLPRLVTCEACLGAMPGAGRPTVDPGRVWTVPSASAPALPTIVVERGSGRVLVDGVPVPGLIAEDGVSVEVGSVVSFVSVRLLADRVELVDELPGVSDD